MHSAPGATAEPQARHRGRQRHAVARQRAHQSLGVIAMTDLTIEREVSTCRPTSCRAPSPNPTRSSGSPTGSSSATAPPGADLRRARLGGRGCHGRHRRGRLPMGQQGDAATTANSGAPRRPRGHRSDIVLLVETGVDAEPGRGEWRTLRTTATAGSTTPPGLVTCSPAEHVHHRQPVAVVGSSIRWSAAATARPTARHVPFTLQAVTSRRPRRGRPGDVPPGRSRGLVSHRTGSARRRHARHEPPRRRSLAGWRRSSDWPKRLIGSKPPPIPTMPASVLRQA